MCKFASHLRKNIYCVTRWNAQYFLAIFGKLLKDKLDNFSNAPVKLVTHVH